MANSKFDVAAYHTEHLMPMIDAQITIFQNADDISAMFDGIVNRGAATQGALPPRTQNTDGYGIGDGDEQNYNERRWSAKLDLEINNPIVISATDLKLYAIEDRMKQLAMSQASTICSKVESELAKAASFGGFRYFGRSQADNETFTIDDLRKAMTVARNYAGAAPLYCYLPDATSTLVANTGYQQFLTKRNDETAQTNELQDINGVVNARFFQTQHYKQHEAGTAARKELTISAIENTQYTYKDKPYTGTRITVTGADENDTVKANDVLSVTTRKSYFIRDDLSISSNIVQGTILSDAVATADSLTFDVNVDWLTSSQTNGNFTNTSIVSEPIQVGDKILIEGDHVAGFVFIKEGLKRASVSMGEPDPFKPDSHSYYEDKGVQGLNIRCWSGMDIRSANRAIVQDGLAGVAAVSPYVMRLVLPINSINLY